MYSLHPAGCGVGLLLLLACRRRSSPRREREFWGCLGGPSPEQFLDADAALAKVLVWRVLPKAEHDADGDAGRRVESAVGERGLGVLNQCCEPTGPTDGEASGPKGCTSQRRDAVARAIAQG